MTLDPLDFWLPHDSDAITAPSNTCITETSFDDILRVCDEIKKMPPVLCKITVGSYTVAAIKREFASQPDGFPASAFGPMGIPVYNDDDWDMPRPRAELEFSDGSKRVIPLYERPNNPMLMIAEYLKA